MQQWCRFPVIKGKTSEKTPPAFFKMVGFFTMTMLLLTPTFHSRVFGSKNIPLVSHPPYSPDLAPCDFFSSLK
jgi:hypothetical protein